MLWQVLSIGFRKVLDTHHNPFTHKTDATDEVAITYTSNDDHFHFCEPSQPPYQIRPFKNPTFCMFLRENRSFLELFPALRKFVAHFTPPLLSDEHNKQKWALKWSELKKKHHSPPLQNSCAATCQLCSLTSTSHGGGVWPRTTRCHSFRTSCFAGWCYFQISTHTHKYTNRLFF